MSDTNISYNNSLTASLRIKEWRAEKAHGRLSLDGLLKNAVWTYFFLLIFEGALRKWILPGLATPLLIVRDPIALWILFQSLKKGYLNYNIYLIFMTVVTAMAFFTALLFGHGSFAVALFGARILILHFPLVFAIGKIFNQEDVIKMGRWVLYISIPMLVLIVLQFYSPQSAFVNRGVGGDESGSGFTGAMGYFRPSATFSFTSGTSTFFSLVGVFVYYFWIKPGQINKLILLGASAALLFSIPFSISRMLFFSLGLFFLFAAFALSLSPRGIAVMIGIVIAMGILILLLSKFAFAQKAIEAFTNRFQTANKAEGGLNGVLVDRYLGGMLGALDNPSAKLPFWGFGLGMGTNVGSVILTGKAVFLVAEGEWGRLVGEMGLLLGLIVILIRLFLSLDITIKAYKRLSKKDYLPWMLTAMVLLNLPQGQWAQPTSLGFCVLVTGLALASLNTYE